MHNFTGVSLRLHTDTLRTSEKKRCHFALFSSASPFHPSYVVIIRAPLSDALMTDYWQNSAALLPAEAAGPGGDCENSLVMKADGCRRDRATAFASAYTLSIC